MDSHPVVAVHQTVAQVVEMGHGDAGQTLVLLVAEDREPAAQDMTQCRS